MSVLLVAPTPESGKSRWEPAASILLGTQTTFVLRPGDPNPNPAPNVYTTTAGLREALNNSTGPRVVSIDGSFVAFNVTLDAGVYGDEHVVIQGDPTNTSLTVIIAEGALIRARQWVYPMSIVWTGSTPIHTLATGLLFFDKGARVRRDVSAGGPMWVVAAGASIFLSFYLGGAFESDSGPLLHLGVGANLQANPLDFGTIGADTLSGDVTAFALSLVTVPSGTISFPQPSFLGTLLVTKLPFPAYVSGAGPTSVDNQTQSVTVDIAAPHTIFLPSIDEVPSGWEITFAKYDASGAVATVDGSGALINGAATKTITAQYESFTIQRHAVNNFSSPEWIVISEVP